LKHSSAPFSVGLSFGLAIALLVIASLTLPAVPAQSREPDKTLKLFFGHTGERAEFTFKRNGKYDRTELARLNHFLRDWRKGEDARMDPQLLDLVWAVYRESGSRDYIHVVSAYRSPQTNELLRRRSSGVAKNSQHRLGKAMDWYVADVSLAKLRTAAMKMQGGGVGYYPRSGSPFIHTDTGSVRAWPRMTRQQLLAVFPNGNTLHLPADGKPLPGYELAVARRQAQGGTALAYLEAEPSESEVTDRTGTDPATRNWLARVFPGDEADDAATAAAAAEDAPEPAGEVPLLASAESDALESRVPRPRPGSETRADEASQSIVLASADATAAGFLVMPALSSAMPGAEELGIGARRAPPAGAEDAIATLLTDEAEAAPRAPGPTLAYAPAANASTATVSEADRAIIAAFSAVDQSGVVSQADAALVAALTRAAAGEAGLDEESAELYPGVIVTAADLAAYQNDEDVLLDLIDAAAPVDPNVATLAMPKPQQEDALFVAPGAASEVADLRGASGPPVDRFATATAEPAREQEGFFTKLFASLIE
jgi:uncharacterized protein YcbK (DUF882 family)